MSLRIGIDIGSTTVKVVVLDEANKLLFRSYERHYSKTRQRALETLQSIKNMLSGQMVKLVITGSAGLGVAKAAELDFVQEVYATAAAVNTYIPNTDAVIELGGEDAKIIFFGGALEERMNGSCAGGTGAFIDQMATLMNVTVNELDALSLKHEKIYPIASRGKIVNRGPRNIKINGENIKPLLAAQAEAQPNVTVLNHVNITDLMIQDGRVVGAYGFSVGAPVAYAIRARAVFVATGGAAGLYRPNNPGFSRHKMWYPPFNTGAGYAMGIRAGAEMTTFEMRFIALRCKDTIAPTGTIAQGVGAPQHNARGEDYEGRYGHTTSERLYGTVSENRAGRGPCVLGTRGIGADAEADLYKAYLNMAPSQTLRWLENGQGPDAEDVEIEGTEPYIVGGHTASGYWIDAGRRTTLPGLYAGGDVAGGAPQKYVTGALAEGQIAAESILKDLDHLDFADEDTAARPDYGAYFAREPQHVDTEQLEEAMQKVMDEYAGGISQGYQYNEARLETAKRRIAELTDLSATLSADSMDDLLRIYELNDRLTVCPVLIAHLEARKETRWHSFAENADYPDKDPAYACYINSVTKNGETQIIKRKLR